MTEDCHAYVDGLIAAVVDSVFQSRDVTARPLYFHYRPTDSNGKGAIGAHADTPGGWKLVTGERLPMMADRNQLGNWLRQYTGRLPIL